MAANAQVSGLSEWRATRSLASAFSLGVHAQEAKPAPCSAPEHRQFDFWLGDWEVRGPGRQGRRSQHHHVGAWRMRHLRKLERRGRRDRVELQRLRPGEEEVAPDLGRRHGRHPRPRRRRSATAAWCSRARRRRRPTPSIASRGNACRTAASASCGRRRATAARRGRQRSTATTRRSNEALLHTRGLLAVSRTP